MLFVWLGEVLVVRSVEMVVEWLWVVVVSKGVWLEELVELVGIFKLSSVWMRLRWFLVVVKWSDVLFVGEVVWGCVLFLRKRLVILR